jgi:hypothetical protein
MGMKKQWWGKNARSEKEMESRRTTNKHTNKLKNNKYIINE